MEVTSFPETKYTSRIIKAGALLGDTKSLLYQWDEGLSVAQNLQRIRENNLLAKSSRSRLDDILPIFRRRPTENKRQFLEVSAEIVERVDPIFYSDPHTAVIKSLGLA